MKYRIRLCVANVKSQFTTKHLMCKFEANQKLNCFVYKGTKPHCSVLSYWYVCD